TIRLPLPGQPAVQAAIQPATVRAGEQAAALRLVQQRADVHALQRAARQPPLAACAVALEDADPLQRPHQHLARRGVLRVYVTPVGRETNRHWSLLSLPHALSSSQDRLTARRPRAPAPARRPGRARAPCPS